MKKQVTMEDMNVFETILLMIIALIYISGKVWWLTLIGILYYLFCVQGILV